MRLEGICKRHMLLGLFLWEISVNFVVNAKNHKFLKFFSKNKTKPLLIVSIHQKDK